MYNIRIKDFGNGKKQYSFYSRPVGDSNKSLEQKILDDIEFYRNLLESAQDDKQRKFIVSKINALRDKYDIEKSITPDELTEEQLEKYNENAENRRINYRLKGDKRAKNKIWDYARSNVWDYFLTFTFNKKMVDRYNYDECKSKLSKWLNNASQRYCNGELKYLIVPEQHKDGAWHFHGLLSNCGSISMIDSGLRDDAGRIIYNLPQFKYGFTTSTAVTDTNRAAIYITKYVTKALCLTLTGKCRYLCSKNLKCPVISDIYCYDIKDYLTSLYDSESFNVEWAQQKDYVVNGENNYIIYVEVDESDIV